MWFSLLQGSCVMPTPNKTMGLRAYLAASRTFFGFSLTTKRGEARCSVASATKIPLSLSWSARNVTRSPGHHVTLRADQERLSGIFVADATEHRASPRFVVRENPKKVLEAARYALRPIVLFGVGITQLPCSSENHMLACLDVDAGIYPGGFAGELYFLRSALFAGRGL